MLHGGLFHFDDNFLPFFNVEEVLFEFLLVVVNFSLFFFLSFSFCYFVNSKWQDNNINDSNKNRTEKKSFYKIFSSPCTTTTTTTKIISATLRRDKKKEALPIKLISNCSVFFSFHGILRSGRAIRVDAWYTKASTNGLHTSSNTGAGERISLQSLSDKTPSNRNCSHFGSLWTSN